MEKHLEIYKTEFQRMYERISQNESPLNVVKDYAPMFEKVGLGPLGAINCLAAFVMTQDRVAKN